MPRTVCRLFSVLRPRLGGACLTVAGSLVMLLSGCQAPVSPEEIQLHTVSSESVAPVTISEGKGIPVALRLSVAEHIDRPEIAVQSGSQLVFSARHQWAEPLSDGLERLIRSRLASTDGVSRVLSVRQESDLRPKVMVTVAVERFEGERSPGGQNGAVIDASWRIARLDKSSALTLASGIFTRDAETWDGKDFEQLKQLLVELADDLGDAVARSLSQSIETLE